MAGKGLMAKGSSRIEDYKERFRKADANNDGYLSILEFHDMLRSAGSKMTDSQIADTFVFFDGPQGDRRISFEEFCLGCDLLLSFEQKVKSLFHELDTSGDGQLEKDELKVLLERSGKSFTEADLDKMFREVDKDGDQRISLEEFLQYCT